MHVIFYNVLFFQKHYNYIFVYGYILISRYILNFKCSLKCTQVFTFILVDLIGLTLEIFVKFLKLFLLKYTYTVKGISNKISKNFEVTFVPDKEMGVYEHKIQYIAKKCFKPKHTPSRCVFFRAIDFPRLEGIMHPTISYHSGSH